MASPVDDVMFQRTAGRVTSPLTSLGQGQPIGIPGGETFTPIPSPGVEFKEGEFYQQPDDAIVYQYYGGQLHALNGQEEAKKWGLELGGTPYGSRYTNVNYLDKLKPPPGGIGTIGGKDPNEIKTGQAYQESRDVISGNLPIIQQRYQRIMDEINKAQETGLSAVERQNRGATGRVTADMAAKGITGGSQEQGLQIQAGEAYSRGVSDLMGSMSALRSAAAEESLLKEQGIRELLAQSKISEVDKVSANRLAQEQWALEEKIGNENILSSIQDRVINDFKMKLQQLLVSMGQYQAVS